MERTIDLVHPRQALKVPSGILMRKCTLFRDNPALATSPYSVRAAVSVRDFRLFVFALEDKNVEVTRTNFHGLSLLCDEFGFVSLSERLCTFRQSTDFPEMAVVEDAEARLRLSALEELALRRNNEFGSLRCELLRQSQAQESTAVALTASLVRLSRIEAEMVRMQSGSKEALA
jgi:hypothetical protein